MMGDLHKGGLQPIAPGQEGGVRLDLDVAGKQNRVRSLIQPQHNRTIVEIVRRLARGRTKARSRRQDDRSNATQANQRIPGGDPVVVRTLLQDQFLEPPRRLRVVNLTAVDKVSDFDLLQ